MNTNLRVIFTPGPDQRATLSTLSETLLENRISVFVCRERLEAWRRVTRPGASFTIRIVVGTKPHDYESTVVSYCESENISCLELEVMPDAMAEVTDAVRQRDLRLERSA